MNTIILVADDDENDLRMIEAALNDDDQPPRMRLARDGVEALDYLHARGRFSGTQGETPALILLDLHMPRVDGWEVLRQVKADERLKLIPIVIFSSSAREVDVRQCYDLGANAYAVKPIDYERFRQTIGAIKAFWTGCNHVARTGPRSFHPSSTPFL